MEMTQKIEAVWLEDYIKGLSWQKLERGWEGTKLRFTIRPTVNTVCYNDIEGDSDILLGMLSKKLGSYGQAGWDGQLSSLTINIYENFGPIFLLIK